MAIRIKNIKKAFGEKEVLKGIDFEFLQGKINMIIGASGSGKSVMLKCIVGLMKPDEGEVWYDDLNFHATDHREIRNIRTQMGMLFQYSALFDSFTVEENIGFPMKMFTRMDTAEIKERVQFCLERVNLLGVEKNYPAELSGGMQKRVGIARAIALNPKYLFVDEPNSGLDPLTAALIDELIQDLTEEYNMTTVVVSHDMNSVVNISDKIMFLHHGLKAWEGDKRSIMRSGNESVDKFVFVSDLIRRDLYDDEPQEAEPQTSNLNALSTKGETQPEPPLEVSLKSSKEEPELPLEAEVETPPSQEVTEMIPSEPEQKEIPEPEAETQEKPEETVTDPEPVKEEFQEPEAETQEEPEEAATDPEPVKEEFPELEAETQEEPEGAATDPEPEQEEFEEPEAETQEEVTQEEPEEAATDPEPEKEEPVKKPVANHPAWLIAELEKRKKETVQESPERSPDERRDLPEPEPRKKKGKKGKKKKKKKGLK